MFGRSYLITIILEPMRWPQRCREIQRGQLLNKLLNPAKESLGGSREEVRSYALTFGARDINPAHDSPLTMNHPVITPVFDA